MKVLLKNNLIPTLQINQKGNLTFLLIFVSYVNPGSLYRFVYEIALDYIIQPKSL